MKLKTTPALNPSSSEEAAQATESVADSTTT
jgi:hypothetical protein